MGLEEQKECIDPKYQRDRGVDTYYPQGTLCFKDPSAGIIVFNAFWFLNLDVNVNGLVLKAWRMLRHRKA